MFYKELKFLYCFYQSSNFYLVFRNKTIKLNEQKYVFNKNNFLPTSKLICNKKATSFSVQL